MATLLPARGGFALFAGYVADAGIVLLFFLHGAKLSRDAIWQGLRNWPLHLAVLAVTFGLFPLLGLGLSRLPGIDPGMAAGILFLTLLPSTVQSSIAFTAIARSGLKDSCTVSIASWRWWAGFSAARPTRHAPARPIEMPAANASVRFVSLTVLLLESSFAILAYAVSGARHSRPITRTSTNPATAKTARQASA